MPSGFQNAVTATKYFVTEHNHVKPPILLHILNAVQTIKANQCLNTIKNLTQNPIISTCTLLSRQCYISFFFFFFVCVGGIVLKRYKNFILMVKLWK